MPCEEINSNLDRDSNFRPPDRKPGSLPFDYPNLLTVQISLCLCLLKSNGMQGVLVSGTICYRLTGELTSSLFLHIDVLNSDH